MAETCKNSLGFYNQLELIFRSAKPGQAAFLGFGWVVEKVRGRDSPHGVFDPWVRWDLGLDRIRSFSVVVVVVVVVVSPFSSKIIKNRLKTPQIIEKSFFEEKKAPAGIYHISTMLVFEKTFF